MSSIRVACPSCGRSLKAPPAAAGRSARCPACGSGVPIPPPPPFDPLSALSDDDAAAPGRISIDALRADSSRPCPYCFEPIQADALKCKHCGEILDARLQKQRRPRKSPGVAALLSLIIPGAGQMYRDRVASGLLWFCVVPIGYLAFVLPGLVLHLLCVILATTGDD